MIRFILLSILIINTASCQLKFDCKSMFEKEVKPAQFKGIVISKFEDSNAHGEPRIRIKMSNGKDSLLSLTYYDDSHLYDSIQPNDSLVKLEGSLDFKVIRKKSLRIFKVGCY
jgi:hypothetical protein